MWKGVEGSIIVQERGRKAKREGGEKGMGGGKMNWYGKGDESREKTMGMKRKRKVMKVRRKWRGREESERRKVLILPLSWKGGKEGFRKRVKEGGWKETDPAIGL